LISPKWIASPCAKKSAFAVFQVRVDLIGEDLRLGGVRGEQHDHVGPFGDLGGRSHDQALLFDLRPALRALAQADADVHPGVAQGKRVGVALAAVADDRDLAARDERGAGVVLVVDGHVALFAGHGSSFCSVSVGFTSVAC
jgi:hypothetical protein